MKKKKKSILIVLSVIALSLFLTLLFGFKLVKTKGRNDGDYHLSEEMKRTIRKDTNDLDYRQIIRYSLRLTGKRLEFSLKNDLAHNKANCIGYAQVCSSICNYAYSVNGIALRTKPVVGYVTLYGINLCPLLQAVVPNRYNGFVKDHDFVELVLDDRVLLFDASLYDYYINATTVVKRD